MGAGTQFAEHWIVHALSIRRILSGSVNSTGKLVGILVLEKRHLWRTFGASLGRQIENEVVLHQFEQCRAKHRIGVVDLTVSMSLEDRNTWQVFLACFATWPRLDVFWQEQWWLLCVRLQVA